MTNNELKAIVKSYFNLTEVKLGEIYDENKAFKFIFDGDVLELGMPVKVVTAEGQEMDAPDGLHKLEDGLVIKTEGSKVVEITKADELAEEETLDGGEEIAEVEMAEVKTPEVVEQFPVEVTEEKPLEMDEADIAKAIAEAVAEKLEEMKAEMAVMKANMEKMSAEPAVEKTLPTKKFSLEKDETSPVNTTRYEMMKKLIKNHKTK